MKSTNVMRNWVRGALLTLVLCLVVTSLVQAKERPREVIPFSETEVRSTDVRWYPQFDYTEIRLKVTGPCEPDIQRVFRPGELPYMKIYDEEGQLLPDGVYAWELRATPKLSEETLEAIDKARITGDKSNLDLPPWENFVQAGYVRIQDGKLVNPDENERRSASDAEESDDLAVILGDEPAISSKGGIHTKDFVIIDDLIVDGSACIGFDCVNGESFGFDTIRLKENNLRIKFQDTSTAASFPTNDWQLTANASANGGASKFSIDDIDGGRTPFTVEARAPSHSLYVDDGGRVGFGTSTPVVELHVIDGDTATLRLEQDGSSGFAPQTWDVAGNETNFFIRDASNGSTLPFRIRPGADTSSIFIDSDSDVGLGTASPAGAFHVENSAADEDDFVITSSSQVGIGTDSPDQDLHITDTDGSGNVAFRLETPTNNHEWDLAVIANNGDFRFTKVGSGSARFILDEDGNITIPGDINTTSCSPCISDYVFEDDYELMPLSDLEAFIEANGHLPNMPSEAELQKRGSVPMHLIQTRTLEKVEELTLYTLQQEEALQAQREVLELQRATIEELMARLSRLEEGVTP